MIPFPPLSPTPFLPSFLHVTPLGSADDHHRRRRGLPLPLPLFPAFSKEASSPSSSSSLPPSVSVHMYPHLTSSAELLSPSPSLACCAVTHSRVHLILSFPSLSLLSLSIRTARRDINARWEETSEGFANKFAAQETLIVTSFTLAILRPRFLHLAMGREREERGEEEEEEEGNDKSQKAVARSLGRPRCWGGEGGFCFPPPPPHKSLFCFVSFFFARFFFFFCSLSLRSFMRSVSTEERRMGKGGDFLFSLPLRKTSRKKKEMSANF